MWPKIGLKIVARNNIDIIPVDPIVEAIGQRLRVKVIRNREQRPGCMQGMGRNRGLGGRRRERAWVGPGNACAEPDVAIRSGKRPMICYHHDDDIEFFPQFRTSVNLRYDPLYCFAAFRNTGIECHPGQAAG